MLYKIFTLNLARRTLTYFITLSCILFCYRKRMKKLIQMWCKLHLFCKNRPTYFLALLQYIKNVLKLILENTFINIVFSLQFVFSHKYMPWIFFVQKPPEIITWIVVYNTISFSLMKISFNRKICTKWFIS